MDKLMTFTIMFIWICVCLVVMTVAYYDGYQAGYSEAVAALAPESVDEVSR